MPWLLHKKPLLLLSIFGYLDYAHRILHRIKSLDKKYFKLVAKETEYIKQALVIAREGFRLTNDVEFVRFRTQPNLHLCQIDLMIDFNYLPRFLDLVSEMPLRHPYSLQVGGQDDSGVLTEYLLMQGLKNIPHLEAVSLNLCRDPAIESFIKQIVCNSNIRKCLITVPQNHLPALKNCLLALATNDSIIELTLDKMDVFRIT